VTSFFRAFFALDLVDQLVTKSGFRMPSLKPENGFVRGVICFVAARSDETEVAG